MFPYGAGGSGAECNRLSRPTASWLDPARLLSLDRPLRVPRDSQGHG